MTYLISKMVFLGFAAAWFLAASPTNRSSSVKATYDGVILFPWSLTRISTLPFCITPTQEYVVPRSIPITAQQTVSWGMDLGLRAKARNTYRCHSFLVMAPDHSVHVLSEEGREEKTKEQNRKELTSPDRRGFGFLEPF